MISRILETQRDIDEGAAWLIRVEPRFAALYELTGPWPLRRRGGGFENLLAAIMAQQLSVASANAIWRRLQAADLTGRRKVAAAHDDALRACGLSRQKILYAKALANSGINYRGLETLPDTQVIDRLIAVKGIGNWTAEIYTMFSLGRADVFAPGDLALQESARLLFDLPERPQAREFREMAEKWSPWQGVAARALWAYYRIVKDREGVK